MATGRVQENADRVFPWPPQYIRYVLLRVARKVDTVTFGHRHRHLPVPRHGHVVVVWNTRLTPRVVAHGDLQSTRGAILLRSDYVQVGEPRRAGF